MSSSKPNDLSKAPISQYHHILELGGGVRLQHANLAWSGGHSSVPVGTKDIIWGEKGCNLCPGFGVELNHTIW